MTLNMLCRMRKKYSRPEAKTTNEMFRFVVLKWVIYGSPRLFGMSSFTQVIILCCCIPLSGDSMRYHNGRPFSTWDKDPDPLGIHCARAYMGGWWYKNCYKTNLNGLYGSNSDNQVQFTSLLAQIRFYFPRCNTLINITACLF